MSKLKIYMCSGVGAVADEYRYWLDGTSTVTNTRAVNSLLARINELCSELDFLPLTESEQLEHYNSIDLLVIALQFAKKYSGDNDKLARAGRLLQQCVNDGAFDYNSTQDGERSAHLDAIFNAVSADFDNGKDSPASGSFVKWWMAVIVPNNKQGLSPSQIAAAKQWFADNNRVGDSLSQYKKLYGDIGEYIYNSADYFLYLYFPASDIPRLPYFIRTKIKKQRELYDYVQKVFTAFYGSEDDLQRIIRTRIIADTKQEPEEAVKQLLQTRGIGSLSVGAILAILSAIAAIVVPIVQALINFAKEVLVAKYAVPANIEDGCPEATDWPEEKKSNMLKYGIIAAVLFLIFK